MPWVWFRLTLSRPRLKMHGWWDHKTQSSHRWVHTKPCLLVQALIGMWTTSFQVVQSPFFYKLQRILHFKVPRTQVVSDWDLQTHPLIARISHCPPPNQYFLLLPHPPSLNSSRYHRRCQHIIMLALTAPILVQPWTAQVWYRKLSFLSETLMNPILSWEVNLVTGPTWACKVITSN